MMPTSTVQTGALLTFDRFDSWSAGDTVAFMSALCWSDPDETPDPQPDRDADA